MTEQVEKPKKLKRRWLKYSLRTSLLAVTVLCVWLGFFVNRVNKQKQAVEWVRENGGTVLYHFEWDQETGLPINHAEPPGPAWLREWIGIDYLANVSFVSLLNEQVTDIAPLAALTNLRMLNLNRTSVSDISPLASMTKMESLHLACTQVSDISPLVGMKRMQVLHLEKTKVSDLTPLLGMKRVTIGLNPSQKVKIPPELKSQVRRSA